MHLARTPTVHAVFFVYGTQVLNGLIVVRLSTLHDLRIYASFLDCTRRESFVVPCAQLMYLLRIHEP
jgi:hypothetical protein